MRKSKNNRLTSFEIKLGKFYSLTGNNYWSTTIFFFAITILLMVFYKPQIFSKPLDHDAFFYLVKAFEFSGGYWQPIQFQSEGWSLFLAGFIKIFGIESLTEGMLWTRYISLFLMAVCILPYSKLAEKLLGKNFLVPSLLVFSLCTTFLHNAAYGNTESLFILLSLYFVLFLVESTEKPKQLLFAAGLVAFAWYVRPNGVFLLIPLIWIAWNLFKNKKINTKHLVYTLLVFVILSLPHIFLRTYYYDSPFDFGVNSKYWVESPSQIWTENIPGTSFIGCVSENGFGGLLSRFISEGIFTIFRQIVQVFGDFWSLLFLVAMLYFGFIKKEKKTVILIVAVLVFIVGFVPVWKVYGVPRHLFVLIPFVYLVGLRMFAELTANIKFQNLIISIFLISYFVIQVPIVTIMEFNKAGNKFEKPVVKDEWIDWTLQNVKGNIVIGNKKRAAIYMKYIEQNGLSGNFEETKRKVSINCFTPDYYETMKEGWEQFKRKEIKYVFVDEEIMIELPYLREIYSDKWKSKFILRKSYSGSDDWCFPKMDIFDVKY